MRLILVNIFNTFAIVLFLLNLPALGQVSRAKTQWKQVSFCDVTFRVPQTFKAINVSSYDSCVAALGDSEAAISLDFGAFNSKFRKRLVVFDVRKERIRIAGKKAEFVSFQTDQAEGKYFFRLFIKVGDIRGNVFERNKSLLMTLQSDRSADYLVAKRIFKSVRF